MKYKKNQIRRKLILFSVLLFFSFLFSDNSRAQSAIPEFSFPNIKTDSVLSGGVNLKVRVPYAEGIEVDLTPLGSNNPKVKSQATKLEEDFWSISFSLKSVPNGVYYLSAKIKNPYGEFESGKVKVHVDNSKAPETITQKDIEEWENKINSVDSNSFQKSIDNFFNSLLTPEWLKRYFGSETCKNIAQCGAQADPDQDNLANFEEFRLGTDPLKKDTDSDGHFDGDEVQNRFDPLKPSPDHSSDQMKLENPKESGQVQADIYKILNVVSADINSDKTGITMKGTGLPNSFVNIFVYSSPTILTIKTDSNGNWSYTLDKNLEDGQHQVYVAVTDNTGKITAKSEPLFFVKAASAVSIVPIGSTSEISSPVEKRQMSYLTVGMIMAGIALLISLMFIGFKISTSKKEQEQEQLQ